MLDHVCYLAVILVLAGLLVFERLTRQREIRTIIAGIKAKTAMEFRTATGPAPQPEKTKTGDEDPTPFSEEHG